MSDANLLKTLVLEDEWPARNYLVKLIEGTRRAEVVGAVASIDEARGAMAGSPVDVVFVDIQLAATGDSRTGLDLIRSMASDPDAPMFVLATALPQHSLEAFDVGVVDYILKPFTEERVERCLRRLLERRAPRAHAVRRVVARLKNSLVFLDPEQVWAFEAADRLTFVHTPEGKFDIDLSLAAIEASFGRALFRVHRKLARELGLRQAAGA
jgi:DNA-binding LytR/AlgR family response regulator